MADLGPGVTKRGLCSGDALQPVDEAPQDLAVRGTSVLSVATAPTRDNARCKRVGSKLTRVKIAVVRYECTERGVRVRVVSLRLCELANGLSNRDRWRDGFGCWLSGRICCAIRLLLFGW